MSFTKPAGAHGGRSLLVSAALYLVVKLAPHSLSRSGSWDGEEYGLLGSTEWAEEFQNELSAEAVAYLNV